MRLVTKLPEPNTPKPGLTSQSCYKRTGDDSQNLSLFFHSSNLLRSNLHSDTCTDVKLNRVELGHEGIFQGAGYVLCFDLNGGNKGVNIYKSSSCPFNICTCI